MNIYIKFYWLMPDIQDVSGQNKYWIFQLLLYINDAVHKLSAVSVCMLYKDGCVQLVR